MGALLWSNHGYCSLCACTVYTDRQMCGHYTRKDWPKQILHKIHNKWQQPLRIFVLLNVLLYNSAVVLLNWCRESIVYMGMYVVNYFWPKRCSPVTLSIKGWGIVHFCWFLGKTIINPCPLSFPLVFSVSVHFIISRSLSSTSHYMERTLSPHI